MANEKNEKKSTRPNDGVVRRDDAQKPGVQVGNPYVYRVTEHDNREPGIEKDRNGRDRSHCGMTGIQGYPVHVRENPSRFKDSQRDVFEMIEFCLTAPAFGIREADSEDSVVPARRLEKGAVLLVPMNHALLPLRDFAIHSTHTVEVLIIPGDKAKKPTQSGFYPRNWEIRRVSTGLVERDKIEGLASLPVLPPAGSALPALPQQAE